MNGNGACCDGAMLMLACCDGFPTKKGTDGTVQIIEIWENNYDKTQASKHCFTMSGSELDVR